MSRCVSGPLTYLNGLGYSVIRLPRQGILPLDLILEEGDSREDIGSITKMFTSDIPVPAAITQKTAQFSETKTGDMDAKLGIDFLKDALAKFGVSAPSISSQFQGTSLVQIQFRDVVSVKIEFLDIGVYLESGTINKTSPAVRRIFSRSENTRVFIITEVLQSRSIGVSAKKDKHTASTLKIAEIQGVLGGDVAVTSHSSDDSDVSFDGPEYLTFGFRTRELTIVGGKWKIGIPEKPSALTSFADDDESNPETDVDTPILAGDLLDLGFAASA